jgi:hypothetical protein
MYKIKCQTSYIFLHTSYAMMHAYLHFYPQIQQKEVRVATTLLNLMYIIVPILTAPTSGYGIFLCIPMKSEKMQDCNV